MTLVSFKRATIFTHGENGLVNTHVIEGRENRGATSSAEITGLSVTPTRVYGSDIAYYVSRRGTGEVSVNLGVLDLPAEVSDEILGYKKGESGVTFIGNDTEAPYASILLESTNLQGETAMFGLFKGTFSKESITMNSQTGEAITPEAESYVFTAMEDDKEGESQGQVLGKYVGSDEATISALRDLMRPDSSEESGDSTP